MRREANFQVWFSKWIKYIFKKTAAFELKQTTTDSIPFGVVASHQIQALLHVKHDILVYKIPDVGYQSPFDCFSLSETPAFIVIKYPTKIVMIDIDVFVQESNISKRRSLTVDRALELSTYTI